MRVRGELEQVRPLWDGVRVAVLAGLEGRDVLHEDFFRVEDVLDLGELVVRIGEEKVEVLGDARVLVRPVEGVGVEDHEALHR